jgi:hypothetical protein
MNRTKILASFERVPNIIEMARNKAKNFPLDSSNQASIQLHRNVQELQETLLRILPPLIEKLVPGTFRKTKPATCKAPEIGTPRPTIS